MLVVCYDHGLNGKTTKGMYRYGHAFQMKKPCIMHSWCACTLCHWLKIKWKKKVWQAWKCEHVIEKCKNMDLKKSFIGYFKCICTWLFSSFRIEEVLDQGCNMSWRLQHTIHSGYRYLYNLLSTVNVICHFKKMMLFLSKYGMAVDLSGVNHWWYFGVGFFFFW